LKDFCLRLSEERKRLGLTQEEFGALGGVKKLAQFNYEKGERAPDSNYLAAIGEAGADVQYILLGVRSGSVTPAVAATQVSRKTQVFMQNYEALDEDDKRILERMVDMASQQKVRTRSVKRGE
jgi:transcriptional regulator with XRE-family HTH domain